MSESAIADMSAPQIRILPVRTTRTEKNRQYKAAQRERERQTGLVKVEVMLSASDAQLVNWLRTAQSGNAETFIARALVVGAKFAYNSGNVRGGKRRIKGVAK